MPITDLAQMGQPTVKQPQGYPNRSFANTGGNYTYAASAKGDGLGNFCVSPAPGIYLQEVNGSGFGPIIIYDPNYVASNLRYNTTVFGVTGTCIPGVGGDQVLLNTVPSNTSVGGSLTWAQLSMNGFKMNLGGTFRAKCTVNKGYYPNEHHQYQFAVNGTRVGQIFDLSGGTNTYADTVIAQDIAVNPNDVITLWECTVMTSASLGVYAQNFQICAGVPTNITYCTAL